MMGIYAGFTQEESKNISDNIKWGIRERMREGKVCLNCTRFLGYDKDENGRLVVVESEAVIVRKIFELYLKGFGVRKIKNYLEENGIKTVTGNKNRIQRNLNAVSCSCVSVRATERSSGSPLLSLV